MLISTQQAHALYNCEKPDEKCATVQIHKMSNLDLLLHASKSRYPEQLAAAVFLRPKMAMRYHLLPALGRQLAHARPAGPQASTARTPEEKLRRSLALVLELANPDWSELPKIWTYLGSALESLDLDVVTEVISRILQEAQVPEPMKFLQKFSEVPSDSTCWQRFYWLTDADLREFETEREMTIKRIDEEENEEVVTPLSWGENIKEARHHL